MRVLKWSPQKLERGQRIGVKCLKNGTDSRVDGNVLGGREKACGINARTAAAGPYFSCFEMINWDATI